MLYKLKYPRVINYSVNTKYLSYFAAQNQSLNTCDVFKHLSYAKTIKKETNIIKS